MTNTKTRTRKQLPKSIRELVDAARQERTNKTSALCFELAMKFVTDFMLNDANDELTLTQRRAQSREAREWFANCVRAEKGSEISKLLDLEEQIEALAESGSDLEDL